MKHADLRKKTAEELRKMSVELERKISDAAFDVRMGKAKDIREPRALRKQLAVIMTIINEKKVKDKLTDGNANVGKDKADGQSKKQ